MIELNNDKRRRDIKIILTGHFMQSVLLKDAQERLLSISRPFCHQNPTKARAESNRRRTERIEATKVNGHGQSIYDGTCA